VNDSADPAIDRRFPNPLADAAAVPASPAIGAQPNQLGGTRNRVGQDLATTAGEIAFAFNR
jgi:hypothetical protein